jgi:transcription initiation factor TFIID subunit 10
MSSEAPTNGEQPPAAQDTQAEDAERLPLAPQEARMPSRKDVSMREFLNKIDDYAPIVSSLVQMN